MKIYLIRHGDKDGHGFEAALTEVGKIQIKNLAKKILNLPVENIFSSSNPRSIESAKIISNEHGKDFEIVRSIQEFNREIFLEGMSAVDQNERTKYSNLISFLNNIMDKGKNVLLVMNAGVNRAIMCHLLKYPLEAAITLTQDLASLTELERKEIYGKRVWCLNSINNTYS